jgi:peptidoglycan hydrolase CwlO-like protein
METLSFAFGMLTMIAIIFIAVVVLGIVKVYKQQAQIRDLQNCTDQNYDYSNKRMDEIETELVRLNESTISYIDSRIDKLQNNIKEKGSKELLKG